MKVSQWTSSYNAQFRDQNNVISPNAGEPMYHFPGHYDVSHHQRDGGFYPTRAALAAAARSDAEAAGQTVRLPRPQDGPVGYGQAPVRENSSGRTLSFYAPPPAPATQAFSSLRNTTAANGLTTTQRVPLASEGGFGASQRLAAQGEDFSGSQQFPSAAAASAPRGAAPTMPYGDKDLWNHPILPHGDRSSYSQSSPVRMSATGAPFASASARFGNQQAFGASNGAQSAQFGYSAGGAPGASSGRFEQGAALTGLVDPAFVDGPDQWRYDARGVAMSKGVELRRNTDPRHKFHVPGYAGYLRGKQHHYGATFAKVSRECLDTPLDLPTDIDQ